jgi:hypothetical protein
MALNSSQLLSFGTIAREDRSAAARFRWVVRSSFFQSSAGARNNACDRKPQSTRG